MQSLGKNKTWKLAPLRNDKKTIWCKWVLTKNEGFTDKNNIHYKV